MKHDPPKLLLAAFPSILTIFSGSGHAADVVKANNDSNLIGGGSWVGSVAPTASDVAVFNDIYGIENNSLFTGGAINWSGVRIEGSVPRSKAWIANSTYTARVQLGADGVDLSAAPRDLDIFNIEVNGNQTWNIGTGRIFEVGSVGFRGTGDVDITGDGLVILKEDTGGGIYSGTLSVSGGTLELQSLAGGDIAVNAGGRLDSEIFLPNNLALNDGALVVDANTPAVINANQLSLSGTNVIEFADAPLPGVVDVAFYSSLVGGLGNLTVDPAVSGNLRTTPLFSDAGGAISVEFFAGDALTWTGATDGNWDVNTTSNWDNGAATNFFDLDGVSFDDSGANKAISIATPVAPASTSINNTVGNDYSFSGAGGIGGTGGLDKSGDGAATLATANSYAGATTVTGGILVGNWTNGNPFGGTSSIDVTAPGSLRLENADGPIDLAAPLSGDGALVINPLTSGSALDRRLVTLTGDNSSFTGPVLLESPAAFTWRLDDNGTSSGTGPITVEDGAQFWAANATYPQDITLTGDGYADLDGPLGALRLTGTTSVSGGTRWAGNVTITGTPGDSGGTTTDASIGYNAGASGNYYGFIDGSITGGDLGIRSYSANGRERFRLTGANSYGDTIVYANDVAGGGSDQQVQLLVGEPGNTTATLGTGTVYLSGGAGGKTATLVIERDDGYTLPGDVLSVGNTAVTRFISDTGGLGVSTGGNDILVGEEIRVSANVGNSVLNIDPGSTLSSTNLNVGNSSGLAGTLNMTGGDVTVSGTLQAGPAGTGVLNLDGGTVTLGTGGLVGTSGSVLNLGGTAITATAASPLDFPTVNVTAPTTIDIDGNNVTCSSGIAGTDTLTINDTAGGSFFDFLLAGDATVEVPLAGNAVIGKLGVGTLTLAGANTFTGDLSVDDGGLAITGSVSGSDVTVNDATLFTGGAVTGNVEIGSFGASSIGYTGSPLAIDGDLTLLNTIEVDPFAAGTLPAGTYELITFTGTLTGGAGNLALPGGFAPGDFRQSFSFSADADSIDLVVTGSPGALVWDGPGDWDLNTTMPWTGSESFFQIDGVTFDDTATSGTVNLVGSLLPSEVLVNNDVLGYEFTGAGSIDGSASLVKQGPGLLRISTTNTYSGGTLIEGGVLEVAANNALGTGTVTISAGTLRQPHPFANLITNDLVLGDGNSGAAETIVEYDLQSSNVLNMPTIVSGDAPGSKAIIRTIGTSATSSGASYFSGTIFLDGRDLYHDNGAERIGGLSGRISGTGDLYITQSGANNRTRLLNNSNDFVGDVYVEGTAYLQIGTGATSGTVSCMPFGGDLTIAPGAVAAATGDQATKVGALLGSGRMTTNVSGTNTCRLFLGNGDKSGTFTGLMDNQSSTRTLALTKTGTGTQELAGDSTFTGSTIIEDGTLLINTPNPGTPYASAITVQTSGTLAGDAFLGSSLTATAIGATVAPGNSTGLISVAGSANLGGGTLAIEIDDASTPKNDRLDVGGTLTIGGGTLDIISVGSPGQAVYVIATYGSLSGTFAVENIPVDYTLDYAYDDGLTTNNIALVSTTTTPYDAWAASFPGFVDTAPTSDPDADGVDNIGEFGFNGDPTDPSDNGKVFLVTQDGDDGDSDPELILTLAVRAGATFSASSPTLASRDGVDYSVAGSLDLVDFTAAVNVESAAIPPAGAPPVDAGWEYRSFSLDGSDNFPSKGFMRASATASP